ncbi:MAG: hypothetical protein NVS3B25_07310 [Hymenobacter sp.]
MFTIGTKVTCIDSDFTILRCQCPPALVTPVEGDTYTVRGLVLTERGLGVLLDELDNRAVAPGRPEANFAVRRFREVEQDVLALTEAESEPEYFPFTPA